jgi:hypothetical protein
MPGVGAPEPAESVYRRRCTVVRRRAISFAVATIAGAGIFVAGATLSEGASQSTVQSEHQEIARVIRLLERDRGDVRADRSQLNQTFDHALELLRADKGVTEDKAKKVQALLQSMNDASGSQLEFMHSMIDLWSSISQKITR